MAKDDDKRSGLIDEVGIQLDELRRAGDRLDEAVAGQFSVNRTDLRCLGILYRRGRVTAGELADESGLTPGAITTVLDRLERGGFANRVADPADRRRVLVVSTVNDLVAGRLFHECDSAGLLAGSFQTTTWVGRLQIFRSAWSGSTACRFCC